MAGDTRPIDLAARMGPATSERRESGWWAPRMQLVLALMGSVAAAATGALGVWLSLRDGVTSATSGVSRHESALVEMRADLGALRAAQMSQAVTLGRIEATQAAGADTLREVRDSVRDLAREVRGR